MIIPWMSSRLSASAIIQIPSSQEAQPLLGLGCRHIAKKPCSYLRVVLKIESCQIIVSRVPDLCWYLVTTIIVLETLLVSGTIQNQPPGPRIVNHVTERYIQYPGNFVDKIVHVAFQAAVVVAREDHASLFIDDDQMAELDG